MVLNTKSQYAVVVIGYNRLHSLERLCESIKNANYLGDQVDLIFSLDHAQDETVFQFADGFQWDYGNKKVVYHKEKLGLRKHVLSCGGFLEDYEAIAVFEDDLFAAPAFYSYMKQTVMFYQDCDDIAGISFYSFARNGWTGLGFQPVQTEYDVFFMQIAQSWGQIWMRKQWKEFYNWYLENQNNNVFDKIDIPLPIKGYSEASWAKYHVAYCIMENKFFVYPYTALSTCFMEVGVHTKYSDITGQVSLYTDVDKQYRLAEYDENAVKYDAFFERTDLYKYITDMDSEDVRLCVDIYGSKYMFEGYTHLLTSKEYVGLAPLGSYSFQLKPQELNIIYGMQGTDVFLYDIRNVDLCKLTVKDNRWKMWEYFSAPKVTTDFNMMMMYFKKLCHKYFPQKR